MKNNTSLQKETPQNKPAPEILKVELLYNTSGYIGGLRVIRKMTDDVIKKNVLEMTFEEKNELLQELIGKNGIDIIHNKKKKIPKGAKTKQLSKIKIFIS